MAVIASYYSRNRDKCKAKSRAYYWSHREAVLARDKKYRQNNRDKRRAQSRRNYWRKRDEKLIKNREYKRKNLARIRAYERQWRRDNRLVIKIARNMNIGRAHARELIREMTQ